MSLRGMRRAARPSVVAIMWLSLNAPPAGADNLRTAAGPAMVPQGPNWTQATRLQFYSQGQARRSCRSPGLRSCSSRTASRSAPTA
jgi:hypothetical protein